jgi:hypothetical protein
VLVIDASSSMLSTDPRELRKAAAELFVDLARHGDEIAVTGFDGGVRESTGGFVAIRSPEDRAKLKAAIRAVGKDGSWTDFTRASARRSGSSPARRPRPGTSRSWCSSPTAAAIRIRKAPSARPRAPRRPAAEAFCKQRVLDTSVPGLGKARLYAVGLSRSAPREFLEDAARRTGGVGLATDKAEELPRIFAEVYARLLGSTLVEGPTAPEIPITIDEGALSLDVVVVGPKTLGARLFRPDGREVAQGNGKPEIEYFVDSAGIQVLQGHRAAGRHVPVEVTGGGKGGRYAALQNLDLRLAFVDTPEVMEIGTKATFRVRLATPGGRIPPASFLDRHQVAVTAAFKERCSDNWLQHANRALPRGPDDLWGFNLLLQAPGGRVCLVAEMVPGPGGVLTRKSPMAEVRLIPPIHLKAAQIAFGSIKQGQGAKATLDLSGSEIGESCRRRSRSPARRISPSRPPRSRWSPRAPGPSSAPSPWAATRSPARSR